MMNLKPTIELVTFSSGESGSVVSSEQFVCTSKIDSSQDDPIQSSLSKNINHEPSCKRAKQSSALLRRSITNFNGYQDRTLVNTPNNTPIKSNSLTKSDSTVQRNLNDGFEKAFDSIQLSSGPRVTPPIVILTDLTTKCIKSRRLI